MFPGAGQRWSLCCDAVRGGGAEREQWRLLHSLWGFGHSLHYPQSNWAPLVLVPEWVGLCTLQARWVSPTTSPVRLGVCSAAASTPTGVFNQRFEALFPPAGALGCAVCHPVHHNAAALPTLLHNPPPRWVRWPPPGCLSPPLLPVWMNVSSLTPWLLDFHTVRFSVSSGCFLFLNCCPFGCARRHSVSAYTSILAGNPILNFYASPFQDELENPIYFLALLANKVLNAVLFFPPDKFS